MPKGKDKKKKNKKKKHKQESVALPQVTAAPNERPIMVFYTKEFVEMIITNDDLPEDIIDLFLQALQDCKPFEKAGLRPVIGYCHEPQNVLVTSAERLEGLFIQ